MTTVIFTALQTIGFMMRNTSPIGWLPLIIIKIFRDGSFVPFLIAGIFVFLPIVGACVYLDSFYYWKANTVVSAFYYWKADTIVSAF